VKDNRSYPDQSQREKLLSLLLENESLFDVTLGDWNRPPVSTEMKDGEGLSHVIADHTT
jgi:hypothetical protein